MYIYTCIHVHKHTYIHNYHIHTAYIHTHIHTYSCRIQRYTHVYLCSPDPSDVLGRYRSLY